MPDDHGLGRDAELVGDLGLACTGSEEVHSAVGGPEMVTFSLRRRAARG
jgi:hypothetical protein